MNLVLQSDLAMTSRGGGAGGGTHIGQQRTEQQRAELLTPSTDTYHQVESEWRVEQVYAVLGGDCVVSGE